jgi:hypothetical protein
MHGGRMTRGRFTLGAAINLTGAILVIRHGVGVV